MKAWIYILIAVVLQTLWGMVLKILDFGKAWALIKEGHIFNYNFLVQIWPVLAYLILGLCNAIMLSKAYKSLPISIVHATWMGLTLALQVFVDIYFYNERMIVFQYLFILLVLAGIIGMKLSNPKSKTLKN
jgi:quaternary ammonium compound-resistance protein SugE